MCKKSDLLILEIEGFNDGAPQCENCLMERAERAQQMLEAVGLPKNVSPEQLLQDLAKLF